MKQIVREFLEQEEATQAARSKEVRRAKRRKAADRFAKYLVESVERIEANGNPAAAEQQRNFWRRFKQYAHLFPAR